MQKIEDEKDLYREIATWFPRGHVQRIETTTGSGIPDINICLQSKEIWVEAKMVLPAGVILRKEQFAWGHRRVADGGQVFVLAYNANEWMFYIWKFPDIQVSPWHNDAKYVRIDNKPAVAEVSIIAVKTFLFPDIL